MNRIVEARGPGKPTSLDDTEALIFQGTVVGDAFRFQN